MAQFTADIAGMLEIFAIAGGLVLLHVARKDEGDTRLLSLSGWLLIVGGVASGWQAYAKILVGADLVQLYSGLALQGPLLPQQILAELAVLLARDGCADLAAAKGQIPDAKKAISHSLLLAQNA